MSLSIDASTFLERLVTAPPLFWRQDVCLVSPNHPTVNALTPADSTMVGLIAGWANSSAATFKIKCFVDANSLGLPVHYRCSDLAENEIKQNRIDRGRR